MNGELSSRLTFESRIEDLFAKLVGGNSSQVASKVIKAEN